MPVIVSWDYSCYYSRDVAIIFLPLFQSQWFAPFSLEQVGPYINMHKGFVCNQKYFFIVLMLNLQFSPHLVKFQEFNESAFALSDKYVLYFLFGDKK